VSDVKAAHGGQGAADKRDRLALARILRVLLIVHPDDEVVPMHAASLLER
jgi:hypothetical protein